MLIRSLFFAGALVWATSVGAQSKDPAWLDDLREQAAADLGCEVIYFLNIREGELAGRATFEARMQCGDGRRFDAARTEPDQKFIFQTCEVQVC